MVSVRAEWCLQCWISYHWLHIVSCYLKQENVRAALMDLSWGAQYKLQWEVCLLTLFPWKESSTWTHPALVVNRSRLPSLLNFTTWASESSSPTEKISKGPYACEKYDKLDIKSQITHSMRTTFSNFRASNIRMWPPYATAKTKPWSSLETAGLPCTRSKPYNIQKVNNNLYFSCKTHQEDQ